ncbi:MAG: hypothetical protein K2K55_10205 [Duncaniella sp.]|nr:hypothetical protein [Duncaniella sp.]
MTAISPLDTLSLSAILNGQECLRLTLSGCSSLSDVLREVRRAAGTLTGLISLRLRNITQGWSDRIPLVLRPARAGIPSLFD